MTSAEAFRIALERLYDEFEAPRPRYIDGCPCCTDRKTLGVLHDKPLRELTANDLDDYASSLFLTVGSALDFRYFLPRIFEIAATDAGWATCIEVALSKLSYASWKTWPDSEEAAILAFIDAWFVVFADAQRGGDAGSGVSEDIDGLLCGMAWAGIDLTPYLKRLEAYPDAVAALCEANGVRLEQQGQLRNAFWQSWSGYETEAAKVAQFIRSHSN